MNIDELKEDNMNRNYKGRDGESLVKKIKHQQPFGLQFCYRHQVDNHINRRQYTISLKSKWGTNFFPGFNFAWYLNVMEVNTALASGHFQNSGNIMPTLTFWRHSAMQCMEILLGYSMMILVGLFYPLEGLK